MDYKVCLEVVNKLPAIKRYKLKDSQLSHTLAKFVFDSQFLNLPKLNSLVEGLLANQNEDTEDRQPTMNLTADVLVTSEFLAEKIMPWVNLVREELFKSVKAPFQSLREAGEWLRHEKQAQPKIWQLVDGDEFDKAFSHLVKAYKGYPVRLPGLLRSLDYLGEDGKLHSVAITGPAPQDWSIPQERESSQRYSSLSWLENETRIMARATGFTQVSLVQFGLVGIKPILPRYEVRGRLVYQSLPAGEQMQPIHLDIEIRARDLSFQELQEIYTQYREILQLQRGKTLNEKHLALYQLVSSKGGPLKGKGTVAFWNSVRDEWNSLHPNDKHQSWKGVKQNYERIIQKLKDRFESTKLGVVPQEGGFHEGSHS